MKIDSDLNKMMFLHWRTCGTPSRRAGNGTFWVILAIILTVLMLSAVACLASTKGIYSEKQVILAVIGEAEGEKQAGKDAVACAIVNRGGSLKGVYGLHNPRVVKRLYSKKVYQNAVLAVKRSADRDYCHGLIAGADHWEGDSFKRPSWSKGMRLMAHIGNQKFYRKV